ncbi:hypothetical protein Poly59_19190 [Rubripirellula reticaptiva]|uniref:Uncharacterized protein n=1 Tax=Rubripirellula reticaptiva TaxID=2528013 RepID=A0A5C6F710_9BACT|nr:hypothetical protein Poly59_19190 [Rubripirellula reticaptiva]
MIAVRFLGCLFAGSVFLSLISGCGGDSPRQVQETSELSFEDMANQIEQESSVIEEE